MKKLLIICATVATLGGAALSSVQARPSAADVPAAPAIQALGLGQLFDQPNATRSPHRVQGACYRERAIDVWGINFRQETVC